MDLGNLQSPSRPSHKKWMGSMWSRFCNSPTVERIRNQRARRILVAAFALLLVSMPVVGWLTGQIWIVIVLFIPYIAGNILLAASTYGMLDRPMSSLDERQRQARSSILREPYMTGATIGLLSGLMISVGLQAEDAVMMGVLIAVFGVLYLVPSLVLAWTLPDESDHEE